MTTATDLSNIRARDLMCGEIHWTTPDEPLMQAARRMHSSGIRALLVRPGNVRTLPGILTCKDIVGLYGTQDPAVLEHLTVSDVATSPAVCIPAQATVRECIATMRMVGVRRMPVLENNEIVGVLSTTDLFQHLIE
ncbi:MAG: hypothetical protein Fur0037_05070 [Planctomycetota bacterium]